MGDEEKFKDIKYLLIGQQNLSNKRVINKLLRFLDKKIKEIKEIKENKK